MKTKNGANIWGLDPKMRPALVNADRLWGDNGHELTITSGRDGIHSAGSLHYYGLAVDFRTWEEDGVQWSDEKRRRIAGQLQNMLGRKFDVIPHSTHIHVEYDDGSVT